MERIGQFCSYEGRTWKITEVHSTPRGEFYLIQNGDVIMRVSSEEVVTLEGK